MNHRIIIAGGGTGGHIFPAVAIANALRKQEPGIDILFVGAKGKMEMEKVPEAGYPIRGIDIAGFNRSSLIKNIGLPVKLVKSFFQARSIIRSFKPDAAIGVGGYSTYPVLRYAQAVGIPTFIHESNSFPGKSNILLGKKATRVFAASDGLEKFFPKEKLRWTGNPLRTAIVTHKLSRAQGIEFFDLDEQFVTVLVTGGSLGAKSINEAIDAGIPQLEKQRIQLIWQTGKSYTKKAAERAAESKLIWSNDFISKMEYAYAAADMVVSRSGSTLYELCAVKKPVIFIPYPFATEDHQTVNAMNLVEKNAAIMIPDREAHEKLIPAVIALAKDPVRRAELADNIGRLAKTDADQEIAKEILANIHG